MYHASRTVAGKDAGIFLFYFSHSSLFLGLWSIELYLYSSFLSTIDQLTATFIDNIFTNYFFEYYASGNIISDITDHFSQVCIF